MSTAHKTAKTLQRVGDAKDDWPIERMEKLHSELAAFHEESKNGGPESEREDYNQGAKTVLEWIGMAISQEGQALALDAE